MVGLGVLGDQPPNPYQPLLADGIHLRWGFPSDLGFPWHGFHLFRRPAQPGRPLCLSSVTGGLTKGDLPENKHYTALGVLSSNTNLVLTEDFNPNNQVEFALADRNYLRFDLPAGELARRIELRIGFPPQRCLDLQELIAPPPGPALAVTRPNPLELQGTSFAVRDVTGALSSNTVLQSINTTAGPLIGLNCGEGLTIKLAAPSNTVELLMTFWAGMVAQSATFTFEAFDSTNNKVATAQINTLAGPPGTIFPTSRPSTINLTGQNITRIEVSSVGSAARLHRICSDKPKVSGEARVKVTAFSGTTPVHSFTLDGQAGQIVSTFIEGDAISAVEIGPSAGSLVDLCYVPVGQGATQGWDLLPGFSYPMGLPVSQPDYPCSVPNPQSLLTDRVRYQLPADWNGSTFTELHDQLVDLVTGGPGAAPMIDRIFAAPPAVSNPPDANPPKLSTFYILDMILLGSLHPALAQLVGLYWVDQTALPNAAYDYLIVADHTGVGKQDGAGTLATIQSSGFTQLDGFIVFNKRVSANSVFRTPAGLQTYELPGGTFPDAQGQLPQSSNNAGLRWDIGWDGPDALLPEYPVMYLVWRADLGNADTPAPPGVHDLVTKVPPDKAKPVLVTEPRLPNGMAPERSPDWPPVPLHFIDRNLPDGWYSYQVSGIDLFGRHSPNSPPSQILLRDKIPPPIPTAAKADALDPEDPYLHKDDAYQDWYNSLDIVARQTLIGLRVRWRWTPAHQQQAPDTSEFRIYFHPGAALPPDRDQAINWQDRYYVVGYHDNFEIDPASGDRLYEIFLPEPTAPVLTSLPLNPSLAEPVAYAHIGVSAADDKTHTPDGRTTGNWSNRPGNEGRVGAPAKIYRVWRMPPPPPGDVFAGDRLYASPADYHARSFFTYRWQPQPLLKLHVFRALDDAVFKTDWSQRPLKEQLLESQVDFFPAGWNQAMRQAVADELNHLNTFVPVESNTAEAMAYYRGLSDGAMRVLAGLPNSENAFVQLTINPLDPNEVGNANRLGPDNPDDLVLDMNQRAFIDTLDGRSTNCYFYRAALVDDAHNLGPLGLSSPPVYLPNVMPPRAPVITKVLGGDRQITIKWASNREADLVEYRVYRTGNDASTRDLRLMELVHTEPVSPGDPSSRSAEVIWTNESVPGLTTLYYRLAAIDAAGNVSAPSSLATARAFDKSPPPPPTWKRLEWVYLDEAEAEHPVTDQFPEGAIRNKVAALSWDTDERSTTLLERREIAHSTWQPVSEWLEASSFDQVTNTWRYMTYDRHANSATVNFYRLQTLSGTGNLAATFDERQLDPA